MKECMMTIHMNNREFGYPRMTTALWEAGLNVNHKKVWRIMRELSIQSVIRRKRKKSSYTPSVIYPVCDSRLVQQRNCSLAVI
ncbi:IS3 family transposase [Paenibacillus sp. FSL L8-0435]|uniref:IS3 family transposase n=1 Tax=unclassified Paenibacillus TaxID=185978 RepID=UPI0030DCE9E6